MKSGSVRFANRPATLTRTFAHTTINRTEGPLSYATLAEQDSILQP